MLSKWSLWLGIVLPLVCADVQAQNSEGFPLPGAEVAPGFPTPPDVAPGFPNPGDDIGNHFADVVRIRADSSNQCVYHYRPNDGGDAFHWTCWDDPNMEFALDTVAGGFNEVRLRHLISNTCMYAEHGVTAKHWTCWDDPNMVYQVQEFNNGRVRLKHKLSGNCLYSLGDDNGQLTHVGCDINEKNYFHFDRVKRKRYAMNEQTAKLFAPRVYFDRDERFFSGKVEDFLAATRSENGFLTSIEKLECDSCTNPPFLVGNPPPQTPPVYAQIIPRTQNGYQTEVTDIVYWFFFPYNNGKQVCIGLYTSFGCAGAYSSFGSHVGDWEYLSVRFIRGLPMRVYFSAHDTGEIRYWGNGIEKYDETHLVAYSAKGSHGFYREPGAHAYKGLPTGQSLIDDTSKGVAWDTWVNTLVFDYKAFGSYQAPFEFFNREERWGNPKSGCDNHISSLTDECILNDGPTTPMKQGAANPDALEWN